MYADAMSGKAEAELAATKRGLRIIRITPHFRRRVRSFVARCLFAIPFQKIKILVGE